MVSRFEMFTLLIAKLSRSIHKIKKEEMAEYNLKSSHVSCLYYLYKANALTAKELCALCGEDKSNMSRTVKHLEQEGYVYCESAKTKRYQSALLLTEKGKFVGAQIAEKIDKILEEASKGLTKEDRDSLYYGLSLISTNLENICRKYEE